MSFMAEDIFDNIDGDVSIQLISSGSLPPRRSINSLATLTRYFSRRGINVASSLAGSGIQPNDLDDPDGLATPEQELLVLRNIVRLVPEPGLGLSIGSQYHIGILGKLGGAAIHSDTGLDAVRILFRFDQLLLVFLQYELKVQGDLIYVRLRELVDLKDIRIFLCEREVAANYRMVCDVLRERVQLNELRFAYPRPEYASLYQNIFQCPIVFGAPEHMFIVDKNYLFKQLPLANPLARKTYERECEQLCLRLSRQGTMSERLRQEMLFHEDAVPSFNELARRVNLSPRTLNRRLKEEGASYKDLSSSIRKDKAVELLKTTDLPIEQIAERLGYSNLSNFYRAFRSWTGDTPGNFRKRAGMLSFTHQG